MGGEEREEYLPNKLNMHEFKVFEEGRRGSFPKKVSAFYHL